MLTPAQFAAYSAHLAGDPHPLILPPYHDYASYEIDWENYIHTCQGWSNEVDCPSRISLIAMESAPGAPFHPGPSHIFSHLAALAAHPADNYLLYIYNGTFPAIPAAGLTKHQILHGLYSSTNPAGHHRPIVLFDLLPSHGVSLGAHGHRILARGPLHHTLWKEVEINISNKLEFIHHHLLAPCQLGWENVHISFATPPTTVNPPSAIIGYIAAIAPGIHIHTTSINVPVNTVPVSANLQNLITHHGF
jgi:hypothetical protein